MVERLSLSLCGFTKIWKKRLSQDIKRYTSPQNICRCNMTRDHHNPDDNVNPNYNRKRGRKYSITRTRKCKTVIFPLKRILLMFIGFGFLHAVSVTVSPHQNINGSDVPRLTNPSTTTTTLNVLTTASSQIVQNISETTIAKAKSLGGEVVGETSDFSTDCTDPNFPEIHCHAHRVACSMSIGEANVAALTYANAHGNAASAAPHDVRIDRFAKALARRHNSEHHKLSVSVSWQTPSHDITRILTGFAVEIDTANKTQPPHCFFLNITGSNWTREIAMSPRLRFTSSGVFQFANVYDVTVKSLPLAEVHQRFATPSDLNGEGVVSPASQAGDKPGTGENGGSSLPAQNCSKFSHEFQPFASQWTAGFRRIVLHTLARMIQVEFVGAPPQYCFEQYEVRLLDETATEMMHAGIVNAREMHTEMIDNATVYFGEFNFTNLELDRVYIPSLIPVERAVDGRCLCPVNSVDPYDTKIICSCVAADWKPIRLSRLNIVQNDATNLNTSAFPSLVSVSHEEFTNYWPQIFIMNTIILLLFVCVFFLVAHLCQQRNRTGRVRFIKSLNSDLDTVAFSTGDGDSAFANVKPKQNGVSLYFEPAESARQMPFILSAEGKSGGDSLMTLLPTSVLIVYAHDCNEHDACVEALATMLRDVFGLQVALDVWDENSIEHSIADYLSASVVNVDKVIVINSIGALYRFQAKIATAVGYGAANSTKRFVVERTVGGRFDNIFLPQVDMALQHPSIVSARFTGTAITHVLPILNGRLQYVLPSNIAQFVGALLDTNLKQDPRLSHPLVARLNECARQFGVMTCADDDWFVRTHRRRVVRNIEPVERPLAITALPAAPAEEISSSKLKITPIVSPDSEPESEPMAPPSAVASSLTQRVHVQVIRDEEQPSATISFDSGLIATATSDSVPNQATQNFSAAPFTITAPKVTVIPASPMSASPLLWSPKTATVVNEAASGFLSALNQGEDELKSEWLQAEGLHNAITANNDNTTATAPDSGVFTETLDFDLSMALPPSKPTVHVMITQQKNLKGTHDDANGKTTTKLSNGHERLHDKNGRNDKVLNGDLNAVDDDIAADLKFIPAETKVQTAKRRRNKNKRHYVNDSTVVKTCLKVDEDFQDSGMIDEDRDQRPQPITVSQQQRQSIYPSS